MLSKDVKTKIKNKFDTLEKNLTVVLNLLYGYPTLLWPRDHNHRNRCPKINYHPDSSNGGTVNSQRLISKLDCQFPKTNIKVPPPLQLMLI